MHSKKARVLDLSTFKDFVHFQDCYYQWELYIFFVNWLSALGYISY